MNCIRTYKITEIPKFTYKGTEFDSIEPIIKAEISWNRSKVYEAI
jgi:hypothetical protein